MTITLTLGTWIIPLAITIIMFIMMLIANKNEDKDWGLPFIFFSIISITATVTAWIVWLLMILFK